MDPPAVSPDLYDNDYFLTAAAGHEAWARSGGREFDGRYPGTLAVANLRAGETLIDLGCGRGELLAAAVRQGAARAVGVEYSTDAVSLARQTLDAHDATDRAEVLQADIRAVPLPDATGSLVTLLDVVEHLTAAELAATLAEASRLLAPNGRLLVHTLPNRLIYDVTYRMQRLRPGRRWPRDPRNDHERSLHVGEQRLGSLRTALRRAGFVDVCVWHGEWIHDGFVPDPSARVLYRRLAAHRLTRRFGAADIWALGARP